jgi:AraC family transcriptional regulator of adaptative response / DNA-3-methyladenine glycosylase II
MIEQPANTRPDSSVCEQARLTRDARFDGLFFTAVLTTGIYCRPVCPAPTPKSHNVTYFATAAAAAAAGFRPCLRCRPEAAPGSPLHHARSALVAGALRLIEQGALDRDSLPALAARVGISERHLRRVFADELGASPLDVAATRRLLFAKQLLSETTLSITAIAEASGYASLRRFNATFVETYGKPPRDFRRTARGERDDGSITLRLPYRAPYDFPALLTFYARRAIPGVENVSSGLYARSIVHDGTAAWFSVSQRIKDDALSLRLYGAPMGALGGIVARVRRMFDVDADPAAIMQVLSLDALLKPLTKQWPGQRLPGAWDGFELAVRAVLGQQISVAAARTLAARLVERYGTPFPASGQSELHSLFPRPEALVEAPLETIGLPKTRAATLRGLARACVDGTVDFGAQQSLLDFVARISTLPGIGAWTAHYIAMRALSQPDAFPAGDLVLRKLAGNDEAISERAMETLSQAWRPWRAYAVMLLWRSAP